MFLLDSLCVAGLRWVLDTVRTAADAELNDDAALREALLAAEARREAGELSGAEHASLEAELLARIRDVRARREGGAGPVAFDARVEAIVSCDAGEPGGPAGSPGPARSARSVRSRGPRARGIEGTVLGPSPAGPPPATTRTTRTSQTRPARSAGAARRVRARRPSGS